jgi:TP901-1 family phage major tail protein
MGKESGKNFIVLVDTDPPTAVFTKLPGQTNGSFGGGADTSDTTDKDSYWKTALAVAASAEVSFDVVNLGSPQLAILEAAAFTENKTVDCKIIKDIAGNGWSGTFVVSNFTYSGDRSDATRVSVSLQPTADVSVVTP